MSIDVTQKITAAHLARNAYLYIRQSSLRQVLENTESTKRQYALRERAVALGWPIDRIHIIDNDLGQSGAQSVGRDGFQYLVTEVALSKVGIILGLEVSRLARNNADWHRLLELAALSGTLILDEDGIYDPSHFNDRLLLGLKGAMSEAELHVLKARLQGGIRNKARRGELKIPLPIGLIYQEGINVGLDPDLQIQNSIRLIFDTFAQTGSAMAVVRRFNNEHLLFPRRINRGIGKGDVQWGTIGHSRVIQLLRNPSYAGAFVYGRTRGGRTQDLRPTTIKVARKDWQVMIPDAHAGYISWEEFEQNQIKLSNNALSFSLLGRGSVPREGLALLQGRIICGICGSRMRVRYDTRDNKVFHSYVCDEKLVRSAGKICQSVRGQGVDIAISNLIQKSITAETVNIAFAVQQEIVSRIKQSDELRCQQFARASYEAELARRRYIKVDPDNRLVADALEAEWNNKLRILNQIYQEHEQQRKADASMLESESTNQVAGFLEDFSAIWNDPSIPAIERKKIIAYVIEDVTVIKTDKIMLHIRFRGGRTQSLSVEPTLPIARIRKTCPEVIEALDKLLDTYTDLDAATELNKMGYTNWKGEPFTYKKVMTVRIGYKLKSSCERLRDRGYLTAAEVATKLGITQTTVRVLSREGLIQRQSYASNTRYLFNIPKDISFVKGHGGRGSAKAKFITVELS